MKRGEAVFFVGAVLLLLSIQAGAGLLAGLFQILGGFGSIFMLTGLAMWWVDRKKSIKRYVDQRIKAEVERQLRESEEEKESQI